MSGTLNRPVAKHYPNSIPKSLSYESLKVVLKHFEANKRLDLARRCDSLRTADKAALLKIEVLAFEPMKTIINNKCYQLGVYRKFHNRRDDQHYILEGTKTGGAPYDLDRFGFREISEDMKMTPGDINLQFVPLPDKPTVEESRQNATDQNFLMQYVRSRNGSQTDIINECRHIRGEMLLATYHATNRTPQYGSYISFTVRTEHSEKKEYIEYVKTLQEASKYLNTWIFDGRPAIQVKKLEIKSAQMTIRLPPDVKINARIISIPSHVSRTIASFSTILADSNFSLKTIEVFYSESIEEDFAQKNVQEVGKLVVLQSDHNDCFSEDTKWDKFPKRTHFVSERIVEGCLPSIIVSWKASKQQVGTWFSVGYSNKWIVWEAMDELARMFKVREKNSSFMIPLDASRGVEVSYEKMDHMKYESYGSSYILNMKVVGK